MASGSLDMPDPRAEALELLARGRAEISAEMQCLKKRVNPKEVLRRGAQHHPALVIGGGVAVGLAATLLIWRGHQHPVERPMKQAAKAMAGPSHPQSSLTGMWTGRVAQILAPLVMMAVFKNFVNGLKHGPSNSQRL